MVGPLSGFDPRDQHTGFLIREVVVRVHPGGPHGHVAQSRQRQQVESLSSGGSSPPMVTTFGSWRNWQTRHVQTVQIGVRIPASRPSQRGGTWLTRPAQTRLNATGLRPEHVWVDPRVRQCEAEALLLADARSPNPTAGTILRGRGAARVAASLSAKRPTGSNPVRPARKGSSFNGRIPGLHPGDEGSIPSESTISRPSFKG
jgi:hypothetical protein